MFLSRFLQSLMGMCFIGLSTLMPLSAQEENRQTDVADSKKYLWDSPRGNWQVGGRLLSASNQLEPGDPAVFQFVLKNTSDEEQTVVIKQFDDTYPTLGAGNRIALNILGSSSRKHQHRIGAGDTLELRQYRVTVSTEGLLPGKYTADASPAFWVTVKDQPNRGTGIGRRFDIPFVVGDPTQTKWSTPPSADTEAESLYWGSPVNGLVIGMRMPKGRREWNHDDTIEAEMVVRNVSGRVIEFEYEVPDAVDWNMYIQTPDDQHVRLDSVWYSGARARITRNLKLRPFEQAEMFGTQDGQTVHGPRLRILAEKTEFKPGDPRRLITAGGDFKWTAHVTIQQFAVKDLSMVAGCSAVPFTVKASK